MAWNKLLPTVNNLLETLGAAIQANWAAIELGTDPALQITNDKVAAGAGIVDTKLAKITTAGKVDGAAITELNNIPSGAGAIPTANIPNTDGSKLVGLASIPAGSGKIPVANMPNETVKTSGDQSIAGIKTFVSIPILPADPTTDNQAARKKYVDDRITTYAKFGAMVSKTNETVYLAETDGFVISRSVTTLTHYIYSDEFNPPTTEVAIAAVGTTGIVFSITAPVIKGNYWKATGGTQYLYWIPIGQ